MVGGMEGKTNYYEHVSKAEHVFLLKLSYVYG